MFEFLLAFSMVYCLFFFGKFFDDSFFVLSSRGMVRYSVSNSLLSPSLDLGVWGFSILAVLAWLFYSLYKKNVAGPRRFLLVLIQLGLINLAVFGLLGFFPLVLASLILVTLCFAFSETYFGLSRFSLFKRLVLGFVLVISIVEISDLVLVSVPLVFNLNSGPVARHLAVVELNFSNFAYPALPFAYLFFAGLGIFAFIVKVLPSSKIGERFAGFVRHLKGTFQLGNYQPLSCRLPLVLAVIISIVISILFVVFTVLPWVNPTNMLVSVDSPSYYQWLIHMRSIDINSALTFAFANDRAVFLILIYLLSAVISPISVLQFIAALLISLFSVVSLLVLRLFSGFRDIWIFGVLFVPFSFQALGLMYSGYFANMLALIMVFAYFVVFFRALRSWSIFWVFALLVISELILFTHSWTWFVFALSLGMFLFLEWRSAVKKTSLGSRFKLKAIFVAATIVVGLLSDFARKMLFPMSSTTSVFQTVQTSLSYPNAVFLLNGLRQTVNFDLGGVFANQLLIFLMIVGFLFLSTFKSEISNLLTSWIFVASVSILFASADFVFDRFLFLMPSIILSALGLSFIVRFGCGFNGSKRQKYAVEALIVLSVFLVLLNGSLRYLFNINIW
ncbi:MAG: hypothetical protein ABSA79_02325 [Candidatus Bathyarchaeia archaeon]